MPKGSDLQYHIKNTAAPSADYDVLPVTRAGITGAGIVVAVLDDGVQSNHPAFANLDPAQSFDYVSGIADTSGTASDTHGTGVAGVALGDGAWGGPVGVAPKARLASLRIDIGVEPVPGSPGALNPPKQDKSALMAVAAATRFADVANNSYGPDAFVGNQADTIDEDAETIKGFATAVATGRDGRGLNLVFAAGNEGDEGADVSFDAISSHPFVIGVGGIRPDGTPALTLTHGAGLMVSGPAVDVVTAQRFGGTNTLDGNGLPTGSYGGTTGTSFAAPGVAGVIALMLQVNPALGWRDVQEIVVDAARVPGTNAVTKPDGTAWFGTLNSGDFNGGGRHFSTAYGYGVPDADVAVQLAKTWVPYGDSATLRTASAQGVGGTLVVGGEGVVSTSLKFGESLRVQHVQVTLNAPALMSSNLLVTLVAPDGTRSVVADQAGVDQSAATLARGVGTAVPLQDKDGNPKLDANGVEQVNTAPMVFTLNDAGFWGVDAKGQWTLEVTDYKSGERGTLESWGLTFYGDGPAAPQMLVYTPEFATMAAAEPGRLQVRGAGAATIDAAALSGETVIDLRGGAGLLGGVAVTVVGGVRHAIGGRGATTLIGTAGANRLAAGDGDTLIVGNGGEDTVFGGLGRDTLVSDGGSLLVTGGTGTLVVAGAEDVVLSTGADTVIAGAGETEVVTFGSGAEVFGGAGSLLFLAAGGPATVVGGSGRATLFGGAGGGVLAGGAAGGNVLVAGEAAATVIGGGDGDVLFAQGSARQVLAAGSGNETLNGAEGAGGNVFFAGSGNTVISLGSGPDTVFAGSGNASVFGGRGADLYAFVQGRVGGAMVVNGFDAGKGDRVTLQGYAAGEGARAVAAAVGTGGGTAVTLSDNTRIVFAGVAKVDGGVFV